MDTDMLSMNAFEYLQGFKRMNKQNEEHTKLILKIRYFKELKNITKKISESTINGIYINKIQNCKKENIRSTIKKEYIYYWLFSI